LRYQPWAAAGVLLLLSVNVFEPGRDIEVADIVFPVVFTAAPWLLGLSVKVADERAATARAITEDVQRARDRDVRAAAAEERLRIAREMHDVVAHTISAVSLQAQAARLKAAAGQSVDPEELRAIESSAREAMTEMRGLLGVLRADNEEPGSPLAPASGLDDLDRLVAEGRRAGQDIRFERAGERRPVAPFVDTAAYRIAQEALTNSRKHGTGTTHLTVSQHDGVVAIEVDNPVADSNASEGAVGADEGHGLIGLRERVTMLGGDLDVGRAGDRWRLRAVLPAAGPPP
jgi:signal transduction histidine kinase